MHFEYPTFFGGSVISNIVSLLVALIEAAERFKELQSEKEMRQLQEDRKIHKKPPPYKHIKVRFPPWVFCLPPAV